MRANRCARPLALAAFICSCDGQTDEASKANDPLPSYERPSADRESTKREIETKLDALEQLEVIPAQDGPPLPEWAVALERKCEAGEVEPCVELASALHDGYDVPQDWGRAGALLMKACRDRSARGCNLLGALAGNDGASDKAAVAKVLQQACDAGVETACAAAKAPSQDHE